MSRQRHDGKPSEKRPATPRKGQKPSANGAGSTVATPSNARKRRGSSRSPQLIVPATKPTTKPTTAKPAPLSTSTASAPKPKANARKAAAPPTKATPTPQTARKATPRTRAATPTAEPASANAFSDVVVSLEAPALAQMPETPETPDVPEIPEIPETPEVPEEPEVPEIPETPEVPEEPAEPDEPDEPAEPSEPDNPAGRAGEDLKSETETEAQSSEEPLAEDMPVTQNTGRRMPTLAVMAHRRRDDNAPADQPPAVDAAPDIPGPAASSAQDLEAPAVAKNESVAKDASKDALREDAPKSAMLHRQRRGKPATHPSHAAQAAKATAQAARKDEERQEPKTDASKAQQQTNIITRPVSARYSNRRRKAPFAPNLVWENDPRLPYLPWPIRSKSRNRPQPLPPADLLIPVVVAHYCVFGILGLLAALYGLNDATRISGSWALVGAFIAGLGGVAAYLLSESTTLKRFAPHALLVSQLGLLAWAMLVLGPRPSLLALAPALIAIMLLLGGSSLASALAIGSLTIYAILAGLYVSIGIAPVVALAPSTSVVLDVVCIVVGLLATLWLLLAIQAGRERALAIARARRHEADVLRNLVTQFRQEAQDDTGKLESALLQALKGHGISAIPTEGMYRLLAETIMDAASRLEVLQRDREERLRLEGALRVVIRAVERQWLGIEPEWPGNTGTAIDDLVALLRAPRLDMMYQDESQSPSITPRLIPIPTLLVERDTPPPTPISRPLSNAPWLAPRRRMRRLDLYPVPSAEDDLPTPDEDDDPEHTSSGSFWSVRDYQPTPDEP
ncbi:MAG TPA: hypothetical protein VFS83_06145 [Ktedonobacterales bacterium]|nr:hypothetical protein [Ktedonobacterales bacterium]